MLEHDQKTSGSQSTPRRKFQVVTTPSGAVIKKMVYRPNRRPQGIKGIQDHKAFEEQVSKRRRWRHVIGLHTSIAAGAKPETIMLSDGRRLQVYRSKRGKIDFLASGPKRRMDDLSRRMQEGESLALLIAPNTVRSSHQDQTAIRECFSASDRLRALRTRQWVNDLEARLLHLRETASAQPSGTPLGSLARVWFPWNSDGKMPTRNKWISLATWPRKTVQHQASSLLPSPSTNGELSLDAERTSVHSAASPNAQRASIEQPASPRLSTSIELPAPKLEKYISSWITRFEQMSQGRGLNLYVLDECSLGPIVQTYASTSKPLRELRLAWTNTTALPNYSQIQIWEDIMLWCLYNSPYRALRLLSATIWGKSLRPSRYVANDCLIYLTRHFLQRTQNPDPKVFLALLYTTRRFLYKGTDTSERAQTIDDSVIRLLLQHCDDQQGQSLLRLCKENNVSLHANTLLHFLDLSVKWGTISSSVEILQTIASSGFDMSSDQVQSACVKMIRIRIENANEYRVQTKIVTQLLEMGIVPKIAMCNAIILNAVEAGDFKNAWQVYNVAKANGLAPDSVTYGVLLKGASLGGDFDVLERVIREVLSDPPAMQDLRLLHDVLAAISSQNLRWPRNGHSGFGQMLALYKKYCSLTPLRDLHICGTGLDSPSNTSIKIQWPTNWILAQMVASYAHMRRGENDLIAIYNRYSTLISGGHPLISQLAHTDFTANAFIKAFGARSETLRYCPTVVKQMLEDPNSKTLVKDKAYTPHGASQDNDVNSANPLSGTTVELASNDAPTSPLKYSLPTVRTWSILAAAYLRHGQKLAAKKVARLMEDRGLRLDKVGWNTLISGYAGMQDVKSAVDAVGRMQAAGHETDQRTLMSLGRLSDRGRLLSALKRVTQPASLETRISSQGQTKSVEVMTSDLEAVKMKQAEAESYLADIPSQLHDANVSPEAETLESVPESEEDRKEQSGFSMAADRPKKGDVGQVVKRNLDGLQRDPGLDAVVNRLAGTTV